MDRLTWIALALCALIAAIAAPLPVWARGCNVGVNVNSFQNFSAADQEAIVEQLVRSSVHCVRTSLRPLPRCSGPQSLWLGGGLGFYAGNKTRAAVPRAD